MSDATKAIFKKELFAYFLNPMGYIFLVVFLLASTYLTFAPGWGSFFIAGQADLRAFFQFLPYIFIFLVPAVAMRLWAEERRSGTIELLFTLPITRAEAILGKFLAGWVFLGIALLLTLPLVFTVAYLGDPDWGLIIVGYLGAFLTAGIYLAIGNFFSAASKSQVIAFIVSLLFISLYVVAGSPPALDWLAATFPPFVIDYVQSLSVLTHFDSIQKGVLELKDMAFFLFMILGWLLASAFLLEDVMAD